MFTFFLFFVCSSVARNYAVHCVRVKHGGGRTRVKNKTAMLRAGTHSVFELTSAKTCPLVFFFPVFFNCSSSMCCGRARFAQLAATGHLFVFFVSRKTSLHWATMVQSPSHLLSLPASVILNGFNPCDFASEPWHDGLTVFSPLTSPRARFSFSRRFLCEVFFCRLRSYSSAATATDTTGIYSRRQWLVNRESLQFDANKTQFHSATTVTHTTAQTHKDAARQRVTTRSPMRMPTSPVRHPCVCIGGSDSTEALVYRKCSIFCVAKEFFSQSRNDQFEKQQAQCEEDAIE